MIHEPQFEHDCETCIYLGSIITGGSGANVVDLYFHPDYKGDNSQSTVISRYGKDGDYSSGLCFAKPDSVAALYCAAKLAIEKGLLTEDDLARATER